MKTTNKQVRDAAYYAANSDKIKARANAYRLAHPAETKARKSAYHIQNIDKVRTANREGAFCHEKMD